MLNINDVVALEKIKNPNSYFKSKIYGRDKTRKAYFVIRSISEKKMELLPVEDLDNIHLSKKQNEYESLKQDIRDLDKAIACFIYPRLILFKERILKNVDKLVEMYKKGFIDGVNLMINCLNGKEK